MTLGLYRSTRRTTRFIVKATRSYCRRYLVPWLVGEPGTMPSQNNGYMSTRAAGTMAIVERKNANNGTMIDTVLH